MVSGIKSIMRIYNLYYYAISIFVFFFISNYKYWNIITFKSEKTILGIIYIFDLDQWLNNKFNIIEIIMIINYRHDFHAI